MNDPQGLKDWAYTAFGPRLGRIVYVSLAPVGVVFVVVIAVATLWFGRPQKPTEVPLSQRLESGAASSSSAGQIAQPPKQAERPEDVGEVPEAKVRRSESEPSPRSIEPSEPVQADQPPSSQNCTVNGGTVEGTLVLDCSR